VLETLSGLKSNFGVLINHLRVGGKAARSGVVRIPNATCIRARNAADTADVDLVCTDASNNVVVGGVTMLALASGEYTPTLTGVANVAASTSAPAQYLRVGNVVSVWGAVSIDPTAAGSTQLGISLPIASNLAAITDLSGTGGRQDGSASDTQPVFIYGDVTNDRAEMIFPAISTANRAVYYTFAYKVI